MMAHKWEQCMLLMHAHGVGTKRLFILLDRRQMLISSPTLKTFIRRDLLECYRRFFNSKTTFAFSESNSEFDMNL